MHNMMMEETLVKYQDELWIVPAHLDNRRAGMSSYILHSSCARCLKTQGGISHFITDSISLSFWQLLSPPFSNQDYSSQMCSTSYLG